MATIYSDASACEVHEEDRELVEKLAKIQKMYHQVYQVRKLLPERLIAPIKQATASPHPSHAVSPAALAAQLRKVAIEGGGQFQAFKKEWHSDEMRSLWEQTKTANFPQGDDCWRSDYEKLAKETSGSIQVAQEKIQELEEQQQSVSEDPKEVIEQIKNKYPTLRILTSDEAVGVPFDAKISGLSFRVDQTQQEAAISYSVVGTPGTKQPSLTHEIVRFLGDRKNKNSLSYLMNLLASYADVKTRPCDKCSKVFDDSLQLAIVKVPNKEDLDAGPEWSSFHQQCS